jgi:hypothetical protein
MPAWLNFLVATAKLTDITPGAAFQARGRV